MAVDQFHLSSKSHESRPGMFQGFRVPVDPDKTSLWTDCLQDSLGVSSQPDRGIHDNGPGLKRQPLENFLKKNGLMDDYSMLSFEYRRTRS